jgi:hypothetical protein
MCPFLTHQSDEVVIVVEAIGNGSEVIPLVIGEEFRMIRQREDIQESFIAGEAIQFLWAAQPI